MADNIVVTRHDHVAEVKLNRASVRNALDGKTLDELFETFENFRTDAAVRVVVLTHAGDAFCAGADLAWLSAFGDNTSTESARLQRTMIAIDESAKLVIAAINGPAFAGGLALVSACDAVIATRRSTFCLSEVRIGMSPAIATALLSRRINAGQLRYLGTTAAVVNAERAHQIGLVDELAEDEAELKMLVQKACARAADCEPVAIGKFKLLLSLLLDDPVDRHSMALQSFIRGRRSPNVEAGLKAIRAREKAPWARK